MLGGTYRLGGFEPGSGCQTHGLIQKHELKGFSEDPVLKPDSISVYSDWVPVQIYGITSSGVSRITELLLVAVSGHSGGIFAEKPGLTCQGIGLFANPRGQGSANP